MKREFKLGDKIVAYDTDERITGIIVNVGRLLSAKDSHGVSLLFHPKQCRHLKKKEPSVCVTRQKLAEAYQNALCGHDSQNEILKDICARLGLPESEE